MDQLKDIIYAPCLRSSTYDLLALREIEERRRKRISPIISARGNDLALISEFAKYWEGDSFWLDSSRFPQDSQTELTKKLNDPSGNFDGKFSAFSKIKQINPGTLPVVGFSSGDKPRNVVQFALRLYKEFSAVAIRIEGSGAVLERNLATARAVLNAVSDEDLARTTIILDAWSISQIPSMQEGSSLQKMLRLTEEYDVANVITLSTSWPDDRPDRGVNATVPCIDPFWQAITHKQLGTRGVAHVYGDYAATNPMRDLLDDFDPKKMAQPIPFAGYYNACSWHQERHGAGGENEKYRDIARSFRALGNYHGDEFCWGTRAIGAIASGAREKPGNMAFWNKIRINQHICAMLEDLSGGLLQALSNPHEPEYDDLDDLI